MTEKIRVLFFSSNRYGCIWALKHLIDGGFEVVGCVHDSSSKSQISVFCDQYSIPCYTAEKMYEDLEDGIFPEFEFGIVYLHHKILKAPIINFARRGIINFHPAPVETHRGVAACCYCLLNGYEEWAVTAHFLTTGIDEGDIIMERAFSIKAAKTAIEVERIAQQESIILLDDILSLLKSGDELPRKRQILSSGYYFSTRELERQKEIKDSDSAVEIDKKINSLWFPPYHGAYIIIDGEKYSLVNETILNELAKLYDSSK